jgi:hypothetical protein
MRRAARLQAAAADVTWVSLFTVGVIRLLVKLGVPSAANTTISTTYPPPAT